MSDTSIPQKEPAGPVPHGGETAALKHSFIEDDGDYTLTSPIAILGVLRFLIRRGEYVSVIFNQGSESMMTTLIDADPDGGWLVFDYGGSEQSNKRMLAASRHIFQSAPDGVRIQFATSDVELIEYGGRPAFTTDFPASLVRLQRREFYRLEVPRTQGPTLLFFGLDRLRLPLHDLSVGGVGLTLPKEHESLVFNVLDRHRVRLDLPEAETLDVEVEVRNIVDVPTRAGGKQRRVGFQFIEPPRNLEATVQRYMARIERERRQLLGG